jgi:type II secretory pathway pseudopilin PulG
MTGVIVTLIVVGVLIIGVTAAVLITRSNASSRKQNRELAFRKAEKAITLRRQKAISAGDSFEVFAADQALETLTQRYIAGKENPE